MPDKHRGEMDFIFPDGAFKALSGTEPLQLYRVFEQEVTASKPFSPPELKRGYALLFCLSGEGTLTMLSDSYPLVCDSVAFLSSNIESTVISTVGKSIHLVVLYLDIPSSDTIRSTGELTPILRYFSQNHNRIVQDATELRVILSSMLSELCLQRPTMLLVKGYFYQLMIAAYRCFLQQLPGDPSAAISVNAVGHTVYAIIRYVDDHLFSMNNLMCMAQELGYSYNYLSHLFRRKTGMTIQAYVSQKKIEQSTRMLTEESYSITQIASMLNYDCIQSFSKAFRRAMHMSPTEFRAMHGIHEHKT